MQLVMVLYDNKRNPRNPALSRLYPSGTNPEATANDHDIDFYATGFKIRDGNNGNMNNADNEYMYLAWAIQHLLDCTAHRRTPANLNN